MKKLSTLFELLNIPTDVEVIYFHASATSMQRMDISMADFFKSLDFYFSSKTTIAMPAYPFKGSESFEYLSQKPVFDVLKTPCKTNLISELFRRMPSVRRSLHPWLTISCKGPLALEIIESHEKAVSLFGADTPYGKIAEFGGTMVGLGVDCNTSSFIHEVDERFSVMYDWYKIYDDEHFDIQCINDENKSVLINTKYLKDKVRKNIYPRAMKSLYQKQDFYFECNLNEIESYAVKIKKYLDFTFEKNKSVVLNDKFPIYYRENPFNCTK